MPAPALFHEAKPTFAGGEFSPKMYSRIDLAKYLTGLKTGRNGFIELQGGFSNRSGFRYVAKAKYNNKKCRLVPFEFSDTQSYMLEFGDQYIRFYINGAQIQQSQWNILTTYTLAQTVTWEGVLYGALTTTTGNQPDISPSDWTISGTGDPAIDLPSPYLEADLPLIKYTQSADTIYLAHPNYAPMTLIRTSDISWNISNFPFINGPFRNENTSTTTLSFNTSGDILTASNPVFNVGHQNSLWRTDIEIAAQSVSGQLIGGLSGDGLPPISTSRDFNILTTGTWTGSFVIQKSTDNGVTWINISQVFTSAANINFNTNGDAAEMCLVRVFIISGDINGNYTLSANAFTASIIMKMFAYTSPTAMSTVSPAITSPAAFFAVQNALGSTWSTTDWFEGAWSTFRGWPSAVTFYQDRLGWASTPDNPLGSWWSKTGNYVDYGISDPLEDDDAINVNMPTRKLNQCQHLLPMFQVLALTSSGEISIGPGGSGDFTPTSVTLLPQTYHGAASVPPVLVGNQAIFVQARSSQVRSISYQYFTNIFTGEILNLVSTHLFDNFTLLDMTYAESPYSTIFTVRSDGQLLCFTYLPEQQISGWTHWDTAGSFESCSVIPNNTYDELWVVVNRANGRFIERLAQRLPTTNTADQFHVDCGIDYSGSPTNGISGLDYLDGQSVIALADGILRGPFTVSGGSITLPVAASNVHIGLPYVSDVETLNIERAGQDGTGQDRRTRGIQATLRFANSLGGYIGPTSDRLHLIVPNPAAGAQALFTGDIPKISITPDWNSQGRIFFRQTAPLPFTLTGVFLSTESGNI